MYGSANKTQYSGGSVWIYKNKLLAGECLCTQLLFGSMCEVATMQG